MTKGSGHPGGSLISVVVATFNASPTLQACIDSVASQDADLVELLVVDGASTDGTAEMVELNRQHIAWSISEPDSGLYSAWNKAVPHVSGDWVVFLGADDVLAGPDVMAAAASHLRSAEGRFSVVYGSVDVVDAQGNVVRTFGQPWCEAGPRFSTEMSIPHPATFQHRSLFETHGSFDESYRIGADYEFLLRELPGHDAVFMPDLTVVRMGAGGLSDNPRTMARVVRETHRARYAHGHVATPDWRSFEVFRATTHARLTQWFGRDAADRVGDAYRALTHTKRKTP